MTQDFFIGSTNQSTMPDIGATPVFPLPPGRFGNTAFVGDDIQTATIYYGLSTFIQTPLTTSLNNIVRAQTEIQFTLGIDNPINNTTTTGNDCRVMVIRGLYPPGLLPTNNPALTPVGCNIGNCQLHTLSNDEGGPSPPLQSRSTQGGYVYYYNDGSSGDIWEARINVTQPMNTGNSFVYGLSLHLNYVR